MADAAKLSETMTIPKKLCPKDEYLWQTHPHRFVEPILCQVNQGISHCQGRLEGIYATWQS